MCKPFGRITKPLRIRVRLRQLSGRSTSILFGNSSGAHADLLLYFLCLLNSRLLSDYLKSISTTLRGGWFRPFPQFMGQLPIKVPKTREEKHLGKQVNDRVVGIIKGKKRLADAHLSDHEREQLEREVEAHEKEIDGLVCTLYGVREIPE